MRILIANQAYTASTCCIVTMAKRLFVALLSLLVLFETTASLPLFRYHSGQYELVSGAESSKSQDQITSETALEGMPDTSSPLVRVKRSFKPRHDHDDRRHKHHGHASSHVRLSSRDQGKAPSSKSWFAANRESPKFVAIAIFVGCLVFMASAFAITCCVHYWEQTKRVKNATHVDVRSRQELPDQVSKIEDADVDVGGH